METDVIRWQLVSMASDDGCKAGIADALWIRWKSNQCCVLTGFDLVFLSKLISNEFNSGLCDLNIKTKYTLYT